MAIDSNGKHYEYRTLQFYGLAYGDNNVSLTTTINGNIVFSGEVPTINSSLPIPPTDDTNEAPLFSLYDTQLFPTNQQGLYTVTITVSGGYGATFGKIYSNYEHLGTRTSQPVAVLANSSIEGNTLTIGSIISGSVHIGQLLSLSNDHNQNLQTQITAGSGLTWTVNNNQTLSDTNIYAYDFDFKPGTATDFVPINLKSEISDVIIDGVAQPIITPQGLIIVPSGSTLSYNLSLRQGSCAQA